MAMVLDTKYKNQPVRLFYTSRAARIYPTFWIAAILALILLLIDNGTSIFDAFLALVMWKKLIILFSNTFIFGLDMTYLLADKQIVLNPPSWSIAIELMFYLIAPFAVRSLGRSAALTACGAAYFLLLSHISVTEIQEFFGTSRITLASINFYLLPPSLLFFGAGASAYHMLYKISSQKFQPSTFQYFFAFIFVVAASTITTYTMAWWQLALVAFMVPGLFSISKFNRYDRLIGELSYPVYMLHFPILIFFRTHHIGESNIGLGNATALASVVFGAAIYLLVDRPIEKWRHKMVAETPVKFA